LHRKGWIWEGLEGRTQKDKAIVRYEGNVQGKNPDKTQPKKCYE